MLVVSCMNAGKGALPKMNLPNETYNNIFIHLQYRNSAKRNAKPTRTAASVELTAGMGFAHVAKATISCQMIRPCVSVREKHQHKHAQCFMYRYTCNDTRTNPSTHFHAHSHRAACLWLKLWTTNWSDKQALKVQR